MESAIQSICDFYGLKLQNFDVTHKNVEYQINDHITTHKLKAIVITQLTISERIRSDNIIQLVRSKGLQVPILVIGQSEKTGPVSIENISGRKIAYLKCDADSKFSGFFKFADMKEITFELSGLQLESEFTNVVWYEINENIDVNPIIQIVKAATVSPYRIFIQIKSKGLEIFYLCLQQDYLAYKSELDQPSAIQDRIEFIALAMFLRYAGGNSCWRSPGYFANLSIDDPWLVEPYGYVSYSGLLNEMEKAKFHTTISFIPWNYDRSESAVVSIFRNHPDKFSLCIHGNNHDHYEFFKYRTKINDPWTAKSIEDHEGNIKQAIARMEAFKRLTGISYYRIMVFPHGIAPEATLELLKKYNFLATLNINHIPLGSDSPSNLKIPLRPYTLQFGNFLSIKRSAIWTKIKIAVELFFGNPLFFSGHHNFFEEGIDAFNETAELVNQLQPNVQWVGLGRITRHMYLLRKWNASDYEVRAFSKCIELKNEKDREIKYHFRKPETFYPAIKKITINAESLPHEKSGDELAFNFTIPQGETRLVNIEYENDLHLNAIDISKNNSRANRLRRFSDFRDMQMTKYSWGRAIIRGYYGSGAYKLKLKRLIIYFLFLLTAVVSGVLAIYKRYRKK